MIELAKLFYDFFGLIGVGILKTLGLWLFSAVISIILGSVTGFFRSKVFRSKGFLIKILDIMVIVLRGIPLFVQALIIYFLLPFVIGVDLGAFVSGVIALGVCSSAYVSEIIRGSINDIPLSQWEAALSLGSTYVQCIFYVITPQIIRKSIQPLTNELIDVMKSTSILSMIGIVELTRVGQNIVVRSMSPIVVYLGLALFYLFFNWLISLLGNRLEKSFKS